MSNQESFVFDDEPAPAPAPVAAFAPAPEPVDVVDIESVEPDESDEPEVPAEPIVEIRTSARRRRTVTAYQEGDRTIVLVPARMSVRDREKYAAELVERLRRREARTRRSDADLMKRAGQLSRQWLGGKAEPVAVRWVSNQRSRWGSCTPTDRTIRLSDRMRDMPPYVVDAVLLHELAHLIHPDHSPAFHALLAPFPDQARAQAYLDGATFGQHHLRD